MKTCSSLFLAIFCVSSRASSICEFTRVRGLFFIIAGWLQKHWGWTAHCVVVCLYLSDKNKEKNMYFTVSKGGFTLLCAICCSQPLLRLLRAHFFFSFFFFCTHLCPAECYGQPSRQQTRKSALLPACWAASSLLSLRPTDCGGTGQPLQANGSCPPPRAENELECCLPQTHQAAARKKDHTTQKLRPKSAGNFLSWGWDLLR